jgi:hypothetical protein
MLRVNQSGRFLGTVLALCITLGVTAAGFGDVVIGDFENGSLDGWQPAPGQSGNPMLSPVPGSTTTPPSNTLGNDVLQVNVGSGGFWGPISVNLVSTPQLRDAFIHATSISYDLTILGNQLNGGAAAGFNGFAQSNEMAINANVANTFSQRQFNTASGDTDSLGHTAQWSGADGTRTLSYDLSHFTIADPTSGNTETYQQFVAAHPELTDVRYWFVTQFGGGNAAATGNFYLDNVRLTGVNVPEPASMSLLALSACGLLLGRRRASSVGNPAKRLV